MIIHTTRFGDVEIAEESIVHMDDGMMGIPGTKRFILMEDQPETPFKWLQSVDDPALAFIVVNPLDFFADYIIELADDEAECLGLEDPADAAVMTTVTVDRDGGWVTTNLLGPVVINSLNLRAKQIVLQDERYGTKHMIGKKTFQHDGTQSAKVA